MNIGILGIEVYFPRYYVNQRDLEIANNVSEGKYTIGLGQEEMGFTGDREDINSICLTVVHSLLEKYEIPTNMIGRIDVGTETIIDKSKSTKTILMDLFSDNSDIEGTTVINACYGGTAALYNAILWAESSSWDGRYAIVVAGDIAVYAEGPARPTGGCGAVALLVGRNAPIVVNMKTRATFCKNSWDFFKPCLESEYPIVNGSLSQEVYLCSLENCYSLFKKKTKLYESQKISVENTDYFLFHSPYNKLVQKSFYRLFFLDILDEIEKWPQFEAYKNSNDVYSYQDKTLENLLRKESENIFREKVQPFCRVSQKIGNAYTASLFLNLANLLDVKGEDLVGKSCLLYSYGSGSISSLFQISFRDADDINFKLASIRERLNLSVRLNNRVCCSPEKLSFALKTRENMGLNKWVPSFSVVDLFPGSYYLCGIDDQFCRSYQRKENSLSVSNCINEVPSACRWCESLPISKGSMKIMITGISAILPGKRSRLTHNDNIDGNGNENENDNDNDKSLHISNSIYDLIYGKNCISEVPVDLQKEILYRRVCVDRKSKLSGCQYDCLKLYGNLEDVDLSVYGLSDQIIQTMDKGVQAAVICGLEALVNAGIITGKEEEGWTLPECMRSNTGIIFASSFPALEALVQETERYFRSISFSRTHTDDLYRIISSSIQNYLHGKIDTSSIDEMKTEIWKSFESFLSSDGSDFQFDRKFLFRILVLGNAQLAQIIKAHGPNLQSSAACAGSTQAIAWAHDMIQVGRAERMIVIAGDCVTSSSLFPWIGSGFLALGAASLQEKLEDAALPFDNRRNGMIISSGAIGIVLESDSAYNVRSNRILTCLPRCQCYCQILSSLVSNSCYHGSSLDRNHIASEFCKFLDQVYLEHRISRCELARNGVYLAHETMTNAAPELSCAFNEVYALRESFGEYFRDLTIVSTKGFTGHPMGVSFEDVLAAEIFSSRRLPSLPSYCSIDPFLGDDIKISDGGRFDGKYALRFAAGFGSQIALILYGMI